MPYYLFILSPTRDTVRVRKIHFNDCGWRVILHRESFYCAWQAEVVRAAELKCPDRKKKCLNKLKGEVGGHVCHIGTSTCQARNK